MKKFFIYGGRTGFLMGIVFAKSDSLKKAKENAALRFPFERPVVEPEELPVVSRFLDGGVAA